MKELTHRLSLNEFKVEVRLGVSDTERATTQTVIISIEIDFFKQPSACLSDDIKDTICYDTLCKNILQFCQEKSFHLLEYLGHQLYSHISAQINGHGTLWLSISKTQPVASLKSSQFTIGKKGA